MPVQEKQVKMMLLALKSTLRFSCEFLFHFSSYATGIWQLSPVTQDDFQSLFSG